MIDPAGRWAAQGLARLFPLHLEGLRAGAELCHPVSKLPFLATCLNWGEPKLHGALGKDEKC